MTLRTFALHAAAPIALVAAAVVHAASAAQPIPPGVQRIPPERLAHYWLLIPESAQANAPNSGYGLDAPTCVTVSYVIEKNGATSHVRLERVVPPGLLGKVARNVVAGMRFAPAAQNLGKNPVHTYVVMPFNLPDPNSTSPADRAERARVLDPCKLPDFLPATK
jgi:hypothetical protein